MNKCMCDMCKWREASQTYEVRKKRANFWRTQTWARVDICDHCAEKLIATKVRKAAEE